MTRQSFDDYQQFVWAQALHPEDRQRTIDAWRQTVEKEAAFLIEHRVRRHDGEWRAWISRIASAHLVATLQKFKADGTASVSRSADPQS